MSPLSSVSALLIRLTCLQTSRTDRFKEEEKIFVEMKLPFYRTDEMKRVSSNLSEAAIELIF